MQLILVVALYTVTILVVCLPTVSSGFSTCNIGINNHDCFLRLLEKTRRKNKIMEDPNGPGKRSNSPDQSGKELQSLEESFLQSSYPESDFRKPECRLLVGGHCLLESLAPAANPREQLESVD